MMLRNRYQNIRNSFEKVVQISRRSHPNSLMQTKKECFDYIESIENIIFLTVNVMLFI